MPEPMLVRDVMRIGVPTCRPEEPVETVARQMVEQNYTAIVVLDEDNDSRGWIGERHLANAYVRLARQTPTGEADVRPTLTAADIMDERVPECPVDIPLEAAFQIMTDLDADHLFFLHHAAGRAWPASVINLRDVVRALAGPEFVRDQGTAAPRPTPMDLFRQRYGLPKKT